MDRDGRTPLHVAAHGNNESQVAELIASGADLDAQDSAGRTPLHLAAQEYAEEAARQLLQAGALVDVVDGHGNSPLFVATFNSQGRGDLIELLRRYGADPDLSNTHGQSPRGLADLIGNYDVAQFFSG